MWTPSKLTQAYGMLLLTTLAWAANTVLGRSAVGHISPMLLVCLRWLLVTAVLAITWRRVLARDLPVLRERVGFVAALGSLGFAGFNALYYSAAHTTTAVHMGIIQGAVPALVVGGASWIDGTRISWLRGVGVCCSLVGAAIVATGGEISTLMQGGIRAGDGYMLLACCLYAGYTVALRRRPAVSALSLMCAMSLSAFLASLPLAVAEAMLGHSAWPTTHGWFVLSLIVLLPSLLGQVLYIRAVGVLGPGRAGVFVNLVPIFSSIMAVSLLGEPFDAPHWLGLISVLGGIGLSEHAALSIARQVR